MRTMRRGMDAGRERKEPVLSGVPEPDRTRQAKNDPKEGMEKEEGGSVTNKTRDLLERVLWRQEELGGAGASISEVADALHRFRLLGRPSDEKELIEAAEDYLRETEKEDTK